MVCVVFIFVVMLLWAVMLTTISRSNKKKYNIMTNIAFNSLSRIFRDREVFFQTEHFEQKEDTTNEYSTTNFEVLGVLYQVYFDTEVLLD
jgi:hypothetical protein